MQRVQGKGVGTGGICTGEMLGEGVSKCALDGKAVTLTASFGWYRFVPAAKGASSC